MPRILIISFVEWAGAFQRPQHMAMGFARLGWRVDYASPGYIHRRARRFESGLALPTGLRVVEPPALPGARRLGVVAGANELLMCRELRRLAEGGWDAIVFNDPRLWRVAARLPARVRILDAMDDLSALSPSREWAERKEREALAVASRVWTGTFMMAERLRGGHAKVRFIPCGVDAERFASPGAEEIATAARELAQRFEGCDAPTKAAPLAGYFGHLNDRVDLRFVEAALQSGWRVLLIGPSSSTMPALPTNPALAWIGPRPYAELPAWLAQMDLALIPYRTDGANRFLYPVKALEYLAGGKPVLSTPLPDVQRFLSDYVLLGESPDDWRRVFTDWPKIQPDAMTRAAKGQAYAQSRSWEAMVGEMAGELATDLGASA